MVREDEGHWEMDSVVGSQGTKESLLVMTERKAARELIFKMENKAQDCVCTVLDN